MPMGLTEGRGPKTVWSNPAEIIRRLTPENPVMVFGADHRLVRVGLDRIGDQARKALQETLRGGAQDRPGSRASTWPRPMRST